MKKGLIIIVIVAVLVIAGCLLGVYAMKSDSSDTKNSAKQNETVTEEDENSSDESDKAKAQIGNGKVLVVYYSAQNHTKKVAEQIAKNLNATTFEIEPEEKYTEDDLDWTNDKSRVSREHENEKLRDDIKLKNTEVPNWDSYDTVLIGYPIWWGIAAYPVNNFVKANDFTGKTVYTFATSVSSGLGNSTELLKDDAKGGSWKDGRRFSSNASNDEIKSWTDNLGL